MAKEENRNTYTLLKIVEPSSDSSMKTGLDSVEVKKNIMPKSHFPVHKIGGFFP